MNVNSESIFQFTQLYVNVIHESEKEMAKEIKANDDLIKNILKGVIN